MRITYSALMVFLATIAAPSVGLAQVLTPFSLWERDPLHQNRLRLDHVVPVATVNLVGDVVALDEPLVVQDPAGEPFVLGAASLDLRDPSHARIVFTLTNASSEAIPWNTVHFIVEEGYSGSRGRSAQRSPRHFSFVRSVGVAWAGHQRQPGKREPQ
jgi:hypothetical protein